MPVRVLFVCLGNICRSPMAEAVFAHQVNEAGLSAVIQVDSAGTGSWHVGEAAHPGTRQVLKEHGITYTGEARQVTLNDFHSFDYIIAMDNSNLNNLRRMLPQETSEQAGENGPTLRRLLDFAQDAPTQEVPDPYYSGRFEDVYQLVLRGAQGLLAHIRAEKGI